MSMLYIYICWGKRDRGSLSSTSHDISLLWLLIYFYILSISDLFMYEYGASIVLMLILDCEPHHYMKFQNVA